MNQKNFKSLASKITGCSIKVYHEATLKTALKKNNYKNECCAKQYNKIEANMESLKN